MTEVNLNTNRWANNTDAAFDGRLGARIRNYMPPWHDTDWTSSKSLNVGSSVQNGRRKREWKCVLPNLKWTQVLPADLGGRKRKWLSNPSPPVKCYVPPHFLILNSFSEAVLCIAYRIHKAKIRHCPSLTTRSSAEKSFHVSSISSQMEFLKMTRRRIWSKQKHLPLKHSKTTEVRVKKGARGGSSNVILVFNVWSSLVANSRRRVPARPRC